MEEEKLKILEMVANGTITPEEALKLLEEIRDESLILLKSSDNDDMEIECKKYENETEMEVGLDLGVTSFSLKKGCEENLYNVKYNKSTGLSNRVFFADKELQISSELRKPSKFDIQTLKKLIDPTSKKCFLELNPNVKLFMNVKFGAGKSELDLTNLRIKRLRLSAGASDTKIIFNELNQEDLDYLKIESGASNLNILGLGNSNCSDIDLTLGACNATLDFSGKTQKNLYTEISIRLGRLNFIVPKNMGVKIRTSDMLADVNLPDFIQKDGYKVSNNIDMVEKFLDLRIDSTVAKISLTWK